LPGGRTLVVDAKTALQSYLDAVEATEDLEREKHLQQHAAQLRTHAKQLGSKAYWERLPTTPDFVVMFVPGDNFYSAAAERDGALFEDAASQRVLIVTPATLIALAKAVAYGWRQETVAENAKAVHELGRDLYKRLVTMGGHIQGVGKKLGDTVKHYNDFVGSLEGSVMPQARKFHDLQVEGTATNEIPTLAPTEQEVRKLAEGRDIILPPDLPPADERREI
jgi:DNA recombination protein RmuC